MQPNLQEMIEKNLGETIITSNNNLNYKYIDEKEKLENK